MLRDMNRTAIFVSAALLLTAAAGVAVLIKPAPLKPPPPPTLSKTLGPVTLDARLSHGAVSAQGGELFAEYTVTLAPGAIEMKEVAVSMAVVLDTSGSMQEQKLDDAKKAAHRLVELLKESDELAFITFGDTAESRPLLRMNDENKRITHAAIDAVIANGATSISGGLEAGSVSLSSASGSKRLVLITDGRPTMGVVTPKELAAIAGRVHDGSVTVTALGVGSDYDGLLTQQLAEWGGGMYGYLRDGGALEEVLGQELVAARTPALRNVRLQLSSTRQLRVTEVPGRNLDGTTLYLADLRPGQPTRVLVRLQASRATEGTLEAMNATLTWNEPLNGERQQLVADLNALAIDDSNAANTVRDEGLWARGVNAAGSSRMVAAAAAWESGDMAKVSSLLDSANSLFGQSADALAGQTEVRKMRSDFSNASADQRKDLSRSLEKKKLADYGREAEAY
jgi:Ca-activated chloride channel family protein